MGSVIHRIEGQSSYSIDCFGRLVVGCLLLETLEQRNVNWC
jgi:hypothetical protein